MWEVIAKDICNPTVLIIIIGCLATVIVWNFKNKVNKSECDLQKEAFIKRLDNYEIVMARIEHRVWDLATGKPPRPLDPDTIDKANRKNSQ